MTDHGFPQRAHPTPDELADLRGDTLEPTRASELAEHVRTCPSCTAEVAAIDQVRELLTTAGRDAPAIPDDVAASLDAAISRAAAERSAGVSSLDDRRSARRHDARSWLGGLGIAAAVLAFVIGGGIALEGLDNGSGDSDDSAAGGSSADRAAAQERAGNSASSPDDAGGGAADVAMQRVTEADLADFARDLARDAGKGARVPAQAYEAPDAAVEACPAPMLTRRTSRSAPVEFQGQVAYVRVNRGTREATVYSCGAPRELLYSTAY